MADLSYIDATQEVKIVGQDSTGNRANYVGADSSGNMTVVDKSDGPVSPGTVALASSLMGGQFNTALPTLTNTQQAAIQVDSNGRLLPSPNPYAVTGTISGTGQSVISVPGGSVIIDVTGTFVGTLNVLGSIGSHGIGLFVSSINGATPLAYTYAQITTTGTYKVLLPAAFTNITIQGGSWTSGTANITINSVYSANVIEAVQLNQANMLTTAYQGGTWTVTANNPSVTFIGNPPPSEAIYAGGSVTTSAPTYTTGTFQGLSLNTSGGLRVDGSGVTQPISAASLPLPTGASTSALQTTGNTALTTINTTLGSPFQAGGSIGNTTFASTQSGTWNINNISGTISLPTGAATSALQTTGNTSLSSIDSKIPSLGQKTMANSSPVVIASDQSAIQIVGNVATGSAVSGNPVQVAGSDGTNVREVSLNLKGTQGAYAVATQDLKDAGRNLTCYYMATQVVSSATDTLVSLTGYKSGAAVAATTTPAVVSAGKTYRINMIIVTYIAVTTAGTIHFALRANTSGVVAIGSPEVFEYAIGASAATAGISQTVCIPVPDGLEFAAGTGIGISMQGFGATGTAAAVGYGMIALKGYEY